MRRNSIRVDTGKFDAQRAIDVRKDVLMASSCTLELADYPIEQTKYYPIPELMFFFRERERRVFEHALLRTN